MESNRYIVQVFVGALSSQYEALSIEASKQTTADEIVVCIVERLNLADPLNYELAEVVGNAHGQECKERRLGALENPVALQILWPKVTCDGAAGGDEAAEHQEYRFCLREKLSDTLWSDSLAAMDPQLIRDYFYRFMYQPRDKEYPDLCQLPDLNEETLLDNLRARFASGNIYTYVGSILIAVNPFKFYPIYNPKYVKLYQNRRLGEMPPHIFAIADAAYHTMLKERRNQCIVISGESGSGKTESTNFLLHHLTALSQKGAHGSGVEQTILAAGPVLEAFGNARTSHNNNSSRFGKFIQVNYKENGQVHGAVAQKYLLEKSRICSQARNERNYHVFYYLLAGATPGERKHLHLLPPEDYHYLNQSECYSVDGLDETHEFSRLRQSMEMVGFSTEKQERLFAVLSAVLLLGNVEFQPKKSTYHHDESVNVKNPELVSVISDLLRVREETLTTSLISKRARASGEMIVMNYRRQEAVAARDTLAKCLYAALFDWIVLQVNHGLLAKKDSARDLQGHYSIGVLDIFGFEDFGNINSFEQFCINYANEHLQFYFNQHVFKYEQEEYKREGIRWTNISFIDNTGCLQLIEGKPSGLLCLLDDMCNFPGATNDTLLQKFHTVNKDNEFYEVPQKFEPAFLIHHYAGKVKYQVADFREKNLDMMRPDIVCMLKCSSMSFVRELVGTDPVAVFRWAILRAFFRAYFAFMNAGYKHSLRSTEEATHEKTSKKHGKHRRHHHHRELALSCCEPLCANQKPPVITDKLLHPNHQHTPAAAVSDHPNHQHTPVAAVSDPPVTNGVDLDDDDDSDIVKRLRKKLSNPRNGEHVLSPPSKRLSVVESSSERPLARGRRSTGRERRESLQSLENRLCPNEAKVFKKATNIVMKNKSFRPTGRSQRNLRNLETMKTLAGHVLSHATTKGHGTKKPPSTVSAQFQTSLHSLMVTLNQANPFFIRCIKSNLEKVPSQFDEAIVRRQLRYTGMLETVRIRQCGYNVRLTYDEFIQHYRILLPRGLVSSQSDVRDFLLTMNLNRDNYQMGSSKVFFRETEKLKLDYRLHQAILARIVTIQRWFRTAVERRNFLSFRNAVVKIQAQIRCFLAQRLLQNLRVRHLAATLIQKIWRGYHVRHWYAQLRQSVVHFQARVRGNNTRERYCEMADEHRKKRQRELAELYVGQPQDVGRLPKDIEKTSADEAFLSKESSQEELDERLFVGRDHRDSEESSGIQEDSESESMHSETHSHETGATSSQTSAPTTPSSPLPPAPLAPPPPDDRRKSSVLEKMKPPSGFDTDRIKKKLSLRRTKSTKSETPAPLQHAACSTLPTPSHAHKLVAGEDSLMIEAHSVELRPRKDSREVDEFPSHRPESLTHNLKTPFHKAKKHLKTFIGGTKKADKRGREREVDAESDSDTEETLTMASSSRSTTPSLLTLESLGAMDEDVLAEKTRQERREARRRLIAERGVLRLRANSQSEENLSPVDRRFSVEPPGGAGLSDRRLSSRDMEPPGGTGVSDRRRSSRDMEPPGGTGVSDRRRSSRDSLRSEGDDGRFRDKSESVSSSLGLGLADLRFIDDRSRRPSEYSVKSTSTLEVRRGRDSKLGHGTVVAQRSVSADRDVRITSALPESKHHLSRTTKIPKGEQCAFCDKPMLSSFFVQGYKCSLCRKYFHTKCLAGSSKLDCHRGPESNGRDGCRSSRKRPAGGRWWSLTKTSEFLDREDKIVRDAVELQRMDEFIARKIYQMEEGDKKAESAVDRVFKQALQEFKQNLISTYSLKQAEGKPMSLRYRDLISNFGQIMETICDQESDPSFPVTMGVNAFRGFLNEFMTSHTAEEKPKAKKNRREKKVKADEALVMLGHSFLPLVINIPTACEICSSFMWLMEKGYVCHNCKLTCHKKCQKKVTTECCKEENRGGEPPPGRHVFGVPLQHLCPGGNKVPPVIEKLLTTIELHGLYVEGLYRKSGVNTRIRQLKDEIEEHQEDVDLQDYPVHVLSAALKAFLREMPEPVMSFELYDDFLRSAQLQDPQDRVHTLYSIMRKLPPHNYVLLERLVFHLARVAQHESVNRMSANALAIVFAPCILRTNKRMQAQDSLNDIGRQTACVETIVSEQLRKLTVTLADIDTLDSACHTAAHRLSSIRTVGKPDVLVTSPTVLSFSAEEEEAELLNLHIRDIQQEKARLTSDLPRLVRSDSDDDLLSTDLSDSIDDIDRLHRAGTQDLVVSTLPLPHHLKKRRDTDGRGPRRRAPSQPQLSKASSSSAVFQSVDAEEEEEAVMV